MTQGRVDQITEPLALQDHEKRIRNLEAVLTRRDYVFLNEIEVAGTTEDTITFTDIPQSYRHLVLEAMIGHPDSPTTGVDVRMTWGAFPTYAYSYDLNGIPAGASAQTSILMPELSLFTDGHPGGPGGDGPHLFGALTAKFPYYSRDDRIKTVLWHAGGWTMDQVGSGGAGFSDDPDEPTPNGFNDPITTLTLEVATEAQVFTEGCLLSIYGIH